MAEIILHHYTLSPFSEKVRVTLGLKGLAWRSVDIAPVPPRPLLAPLILEYLLFWTWFWLENFYRIPRVLWKMFQQRVFRRDLWLQRKREEK